MSIKKITLTLKEIGVLPQSDKEIFARHQGILSLEEIQICRVVSKLNKRDLPSLLFCLNTFVVLVTTIPKETIEVVMINILIVLNILLWQCLISLQRFDFREKCALACLMKSYK